MRATKVIDELNKAEKAKSTNNTKTYTRDDAEQRINSQFVIRSANRFFGSI